jgi:diadenosine tetraphosphate (Ap4A) HIT family hydrolase
VGAPLARRGDLGGAQAVSGIHDEGPTGELGGSIWDDPERWQGLADGSGCPICLRGEPLGILLDRPATWITSDARAATRGYLCVVSKRHVLEPYQLGAKDRAGFWDDVLFAAERLAGLLRPIKVNYEIHGNTLAHLHAHVYARYRGDRFVGGPIDNGRELVANVPLDDLKRALA